MQLPPGLTNSVAVHRHHARLVNYNTLMVLLQRSYCMENTKIRIGHCHVIMHEARGEKQNLSLRAMVPIRNKNVSLEEREGLRNTRLLSWTLKTALST